MNQSHNSRVDKYIVVCKHCGKILLKTKNPFVKFLVTEIKCPQCNKILKLEGEMVVHKLSPASPPLTE